MVLRDILDRFRRDLLALVSAGEPLGVAVSGGADSLALLVMTAAVRPGEVEAATVDHGLRPESRAEAEAVASTCEKFAVPHEILTIEWDERPASAIQEQARTARYAELARWMSRRDLRVLLTGHHLDDQAETLVMRLNRGSGVNGLAGMRPVSSVPGSQGLKLARPLLDWRRSELEHFCASAGEEAAADPSNSDPQYERVRIRQALAASDWLDAEALARSAGHLAAADAALDWAVGRVWTDCVQVEGPRISYLGRDNPDEIQRRILSRIVNDLATEGRSEPLRGHELDRLVDGLKAGRASTLRGVKCEGGATWRFSAAPPRQTPKG